MLILGTLFFGVLLGFTIYERIIFRQIRGTVMESGWENDQAADSKPNYVDVRYEVDGQSYRTRVQILFRGRHQVGSEMKLYVDAKDPLRVQDPLKLPVALILFGMCLACTVAFMGKGRITK